MKFNWIQEHRTKWPICLMCRVLDVSVSGFYDSLKRSPGPRERRREQLAERITKIHTDSRKSYGSPRVHEQLCAEGEVVGENTVASVMQSLEIQGKSPRRRKPMTTDSDHDSPIADNLLERDFVATAPNQKWVADITYIDTGEGWLYLAVVIDLFSRRVVGWALDDHMRATLVCEAFNMALMFRCPVGGLIHHSDRGSQYAGDEFQRMLAKHNVTCSMSRQGNCYDNAVAESFFGTLKTELDEPLPTHDAARSALFNYIEVFYNRQRLHSTLGYKSPAAYEQMHQAA